MKILIIIVFNLLLFNGFAQDQNIKADILCRNFYSLTNHQLFWLKTAKSRYKASEWLNAIEKYDKYGLPVNKEHISELQVNILISKTFKKESKTKLDAQVTTIVLNFLKTLQEGNTHFAHDEISVARDSVYLLQLINFDAREPVSGIIARLDCKDLDYLVLKKFLDDSLTQSDTAKCLSVAISMNFRRFMLMHHQPEYIVVNIPQAEVFYYRNDSLKLSMKAVVGKFKNQTPLIASYITSIVTFPYWNVPHSIAVKEILPKVQDDDGYLKQNNLSVLKANGTRIDESELDWEDYSNRNFPYYFRQSTGNENALGIIKFNLQNPLSIYLHATNWQGVFAKNDRFLSHGCIRLEKPFDLAFELLDGKIDIEELKAGKANTKPSTISIPRKIPTYLIYSTAIIENGRVIFVTDYYKLNNKLI